ncbi:MAG TPA: DUF1543 domain-containing protein [Rhodanobacteraceae bacterium]|nr:DUF1543 domain-containing protein [Rhodanobacteraceae bacterium]
MPTSEGLFACVLGGTACGARTELHDVAFAVGADIDAVHDQLLDAWFGEPHGLHIDAWCRLDHVQGHRVHLRRTPAGNGLHLYFVNIGGYCPGEFGERHAWGFFGAADKAGAKARARASLLPGSERRHKDDLHDVDDCLRVARVAGWHVVLEAAPDAGDPPVSNGYLPLPRATIEAWLARHAG